MLVTEISEQPTKLREPSNNPQQGKIYRVTKIIIDRIEEFDDAPLDFEVAMNPVHVDANQYARSLPLSFLPALPLPLHPAPPPSFQPPSNATRSTFVEPTSIQTHSASTQYGEQGPQTESRAPQEARHATSEDPAERQTQVVANNRKAKLSRRERRAQREERARLLNRGKFDTVTMVHLSNRMTTKMWLSYQRPSGKVGSRDCTICRI